MRAVLLFLAAISSAAEPMVPTLFNPRYTEDRLEQRITDCKEMPAQSVDAIHAWLRSGEWKKGAEFPKPGDVQKTNRPFPKLPSAGTFLFRETGPNDAWVVSLLAGSQFLLVKTAKLAPGGPPIVDIDSLRCIEHKEFAVILEAQIRRSFPEGSHLIDEVNKLRERPSPRNKP